MWAGLSAPSTPPQRLLSRNSTSHFVLHVEVSVLGEVQQGPHFKSGRKGETIWTKWQGPFLRITCPPTLDVSSRSGAPSLTD